MASRSGKTIVRDFVIVTLLVLPTATSDAQSHRARHVTSRNHPPAEVAAKKRTVTAGSLFLTNTARQRKEVIDALPMSRLTPQARQRIMSIAKSPTFYRRLPTQAISCDQDMFLFLTRNPDVLVGIWDLLGITKVRIQRHGPYQLQAEDGSGTTCKVDLVYGDPNLHIFVADGSYDGNLTTKPITGKGVFVLRSQYALNADGATTVTGRLDCFVNFDGIGVDLVVRTLSGLIGRSADNNFVETARFIAQISQSAETNPPAMIDVAQRMPQVGPATKVQFVDVISTVAKRRNASMLTAKRVLYVPDR